MSGVEKTQVAILAGGLGTRLRPFTETVPKPMIDINEKPFLEYKINQLKSFGIKDILICDGYLGNVIEDYFGDGKKIGINISYSHETKPLGTAGAIKNAEPLIKTDPFILMNGDTYYTINLKKLFLSHDKKYPMTMVVTRATNPLEQELIKMDKGIVTSFYKRDTLEHNTYLKNNPSPMINAGIYVFNKEILKLIPSGIKVSLEQEIFPQLIGKIKAFEYNGYLKDLANIKLCKELEQDLIGGKINGC